MVVKIPERMGTVWRREAQEGRGRVPHEADRDGSAEKRERESETKGESAPCSMVKAILFYYPPLTQNHGSL